jgi:hypothetical protein
LTSVGDGGRSDDGAVLGRRVPATERPWDRALLREHDPGPHVDTIELVAQLSEKYGLIESQPNIQDLIQSQ